MFIIDATADDVITFEADGGTPASFDVQFNASNTNAFSIDVNSDLTAAFSLADNVDASDIDIDAGNADATSFTAGNNVSLGSFTGAVSGVDTIDVGDGFTATNTWNTQGGDDVVTIGDDATFGDFKTGDGDDTIVVGANAAFDLLDGGNGTDTLNTQTTGLGEENVETTNVVCFGFGTLIDTPAGPRAVETLRPGDRILTLDNGPQDILWNHHHDQPLEDVERDSRPILIGAGALGNGLPEHDLIVSPQHRILVGERGQLQDRFDSAAFAPATSLTVLDGIRPMMGKRHITWVHFACARHEVVFANGGLSESLLLGPMVVNGLSGMERRILTETYGSAPRHDTALNGPPARECLSVGAVRRVLKKSCAEMNRRPEDEIRKWNLGLAMERYGAALLHEAKLKNHVRTDAA